MIHIYIDSIQLGYYPQLDGLIDLEFDQYYDKLDTEYALAQIDDSKVVVYLNRLSDLLWMLARDFEEDWTPSK